MHRITVECIDREISNLLENGSFSYGNLERLNVLCKAKHNLSHVDYEFTEEDAKAWVARMDPPARWTMEQTTIVMNQSGYSHRPCDFYVVMNMLASDCGKTVAKLGFDRPDVWAALAHDWLTDPDAAPDKLARYWLEVVKH